MKEDSPAARDGATLETASTRYVECNSIRFAYRRLGPQPELRWFCCNISRVISTPGIPPSSMRWLRIAPVIAFDNAGVGRSTGQTPDSVAAMASGRRELHQPVRLFQGRPAWLFTRRLRCPADRRRSRITGPQADPRRHRAAVGGEEHFAGRSPGGVFQQRSAGRASAAVLHPVDRQPVPPARHS